MLSTKKTTSMNNTLLCDTETGACETPLQQNSKKQIIKKADKKPLKIVYFTDPICSACWGIEPQLRKLKLEYGHLIDFEYRMGGLLPNWNYNSGGISKPTDVAIHWKEASEYYQMPIDENIWFEDPLNSSYPPSIAFKAAQMQDKYKAFEFLRKLKELLFLEKKNITKWEYLKSTAIHSNINSKQFETDYKNGKAEQLFKQDLELAQAMRVRGFPTIFIANEEGSQLIVYGFKPYANYENAIKILLPSAIKNKYDTSYKNLFKIYPTLTTREFAELSNISPNNAKEKLQKLANQNILLKKEIKSGVLWIAK